MLSFIFFIVGVIVVYNNVYLKQGNNYITVREYIEDIFQKIKDWLHSRK